MGPVTQPLRVVLLGGGKMSRHHVAALRRLGDRAGIVGVADPSPDALATMKRLVPDAVMEHEAARLFASVDADVAHICTPPAYHAAEARAALEAGLHVYVEKPFALDEAEAAELLALAADRDLRVCAGHQLLYEPPSQMARELVPALGRVVHLESYFSFRQARSGVDGRPPLGAEAQLIDVLPHPVYLLLSFLEEAAPGDPAELVHVRVGRAGTVHALLRRGDVTGTLIVTLGGRPVESYLRLVGTNGTLQADYVRGTVQRAFGPGSSGIDKALAPYRLARQLLGHTTAALGRRFMKRQRSYPGLYEIFEAFHAAIRTGEDSPTAPGSILETVRICQQIGANLEALHVAGSDATGRPGPQTPRILVTGGSGFLGRELLECLRARDVSVRSVTRRHPAPWDRLPHVDYRVADLADGLPVELLRGVETVIHCAAETSGGWAAHERNSIGATEKLMARAAEVGVSHVVYVSSLAVLRGSGPLTETSPLETGKDAGPYVWGKAESERRARELGEQAGIRVTIVRPGALIDWRELDPPGKLGRRLGNILVAVGGRKDVLGVVGVRDAARVVAWLASNPDRAPDVVNLVDPSLPTKRQLVDHLRRANPGLRVVWLPRALLWPLSWMAVLLQKMLRPSTPPIHLAKVFARRTYVIDGALRLWRAVGVGDRVEAPEPAEREELAPAPSGPG